MLKIPELAMNPKKKVKTKCYGEVRTWDSREEAMGYFLGLSESRDRLSGKLFYEFHCNQRRYKLTLMQYADMIVRADVTIKSSKAV